MILIRNLARLLVAAIATVVVVTPAAFAQVITIDQAGALAGGITPGDDPGFPVTLSESGNYRITSNLDVSAFPETSAIEVTEHNVAIHVDGFLIQGAVICSGTPVACTPADSTSVGISSAQDNVSVANGMIHRFGTGVQLADNGRVIGIRSLSNADAGIVVDGHGGIVADSLADGNAGAGIIVTGVGGLVVGSVAHNNNTGIEALGGTVITDNAAAENQLHGIITGSGSTCTNNTAYGNGAYGILAEQGAVVTGNAALGNDIGIFIADGSLAQGNTMYNNLSAGMATGDRPAYLGNVIEDSPKTLQKEYGKGATRLGRGACNGSKLCRYQK